MIFVAPMFVFKTTFDGIDIILRNLRMLSGWAAGCRTALDPNKCEYNRKKDIRTEFIFSSKRDCSLTLQLIEQPLEGFCMDEDILNGKDTRKSKEAKTI